MRKTLGLLLLGFGYIVLLSEGLRTAVAWWLGELEEIGAMEVLLLAALPVLAWIWWRYLSLFRKDCGKGSCVVPDDEHMPR